MGRLINPIFERLPIIKVAFKILQIIKIEQSLFFFNKSSNLSPILTIFYYPSLKKGTFQYFLLSQYLKKFKVAPKLEFLLESSTTLYMT